MNTPNPEASISPGRARGSLAAFLVALCVAVLLYDVLPDETLSQNLILTALLAGATLTVVGVSFPAALRHLCVKPFCGFALWVVIVGFIGGVALVAFNGFAPAADPNAAVHLVVPVLALCITTGIFEEGFFRVLLMNALVEHGPFTKRPWLAAAVLSSILFAFLHVPLVVFSGENAPALMQALLKLAQTGTFGMIMAGLYAENRNLWPCALIHGVFNAFYVGPVYLGLAVPTTYVPGSFDDLAVLALTLVLLIPPAVIVWRKNLKRES